MNEKEFILAIYDIRGKQSYIYKSEKMKEIVGASLIIRDCFQDYLFPAAKEYAESQNGSRGIFTYRDLKEGEDGSFSKENLKKHFEQGYLGEVVYDGGGNFLVIFQNEEIYRRINQLFSVKVLEQTGSLRILTSYISDLDLDDYKKDRDRLYKVHREREQQEYSLHPVNALPIVQVDYESVLPLTRRVPVLGDGSQGNGFSGAEEAWKKVSTESAAKYKKYWSVFKGHKEDREIQGAKILDDLITEKGEDSHLAVIYIDGNNMGAQVQSCIAEQSGAESKNYSYEEAIRRLREFSDQIQKYYINEPRECIEALLEKKEEEHGKNGKKEQAKRFVIYAGDEMTFVCNAGYAYAAVKAYFDSLQKSYEEDRKRPEAEQEFKVRPTSCAGITLFRSHEPFADAYRIAEECCESGKQFMKKEALTSACFMDFHYCQGAVGTSLEDIRAHEETEDMSRPWCISCDAPDDKKAVYFTTEDVEALVGELEKVNHGNSKALGQAAKKGSVAFKLEKDRIIAHKQGAGIDFSLNNKIGDEKQRKYIYDIMQVYDLWFVPEKKEEGEGHE